MVQGAAARPSAGRAAGLIGVVMLLLGASGVFVQLQEALNVIWKVAKKPSAGWRSTLRQRLLSFGMVATICFLLLVSLLVSAALSALGDSLGGAVALKAANIVVSLAVTAFLFGAIFKILPDVRLGWSDVLVGGLFTAALFTLGKAAIGFYIGRSAVASTYGAAGSLIVVLLWVYYSSQLVLVGAEFTRAYATRGGRVVPPKSDSAPTISAFTAAVIGESRLRGGALPLDLVAAPPSRALYAAAAASALAGGTLLRRGSGLGGGLLLGAAAGLLAALGLARRGLPDEDGGPSLTRRLVALIPRDVKVATVVGAAKGGGGEAARHVGRKVKHGVGAS
jgi:hypothetical protein